MPKNDMKTIAAFILCLAGLLLTACINLEPKPDDTRRFALGPVSQVEMAPSETTGEALPIYLMPPHLPTYLDRKELLYRTGSGEVVALPSARWAEPLVDGVARTFAHYLDLQPNIEIAGYYPWPQPSGSHARLTLKFAHLVATDDGLLQVAAHWTLRLPDGRRREGVLEGQDTHWQVGDAEGLVAAHNRVLAAFAASLGEKLE